MRRLLTAIVPDIIIHTACSNRTPQDIEAIVPPARHVTQFTKESSGRFIHLSTDLVFDCEEAPYHEASVPNPISSYGRAKAHVEQIIAKLYPQAAIIRAFFMGSTRSIIKRVGFLMELRRTRQCGYLQMKVEVQSGSNPLLPLYWNSPNQIFLASCISPATSYFPVGILR